MQKESSSVIDIKHVIDKIHISCMMVTIIKKQINENGTISCYMPAIGVYFSAKNEDEIDRKSNDFIQMFFDHYLIPAKTNGLKHLTIDLMKLGFRIDTTMNMKKLLNNNVVSAKLNVKDKDIASYDNDKYKIQKSSLEIAV